MFYVDGFSRYNKGDNTEQYSKTFISKLNTRVRVIASFFVQCVEISVQPACFMKITNNRGQHKKYISNINV